MTALRGRRGVALLITLAVPLAVTLLPLPERSRPRANATPVADNDALYAACGRVFPDPQAFAPSTQALPTESPWAKGNAVCRAVQFIQWEEALSGLNYLSTKFPGFVDVLDLSTGFPDVLDEESGEGFSAGIPIATLAREKAPLIIVRITDESVPEAGKKLFVFPLSIHGIERAGVEGGLRAAEDLATWGTTSPEQPVMETDTTSLPAGEVLKKSSVYFVLANPDGWRRGSFGTPGVSFQRYNGNGVDMNRDWPAIGYTFRPYTAWSEPETRSFGKVLKAIRPKWDGGIDLHGQLIDRAFSFTLLGASQRPYGKNERVLQFTKGAWADAEKRLAWNPLIKSNDTPASCIPPGTSGEVNDPTSGCDVSNRIYGVQWGTIWDTIAYTVTGAFGDWIDSPLGLDADGIDNEMSLSHLSNCGTGTCYIPTAEQLHVDGNKSLIYAMLNYTLLPEDQTFRTNGKTAYLFTPKRITNPGKPSPVAPPGAQAQEDLNFTVTHQGTADTYQEFEVKAPADGVYNGGVRAETTWLNAAAISPGAALATSIEMQVDGDWVELNKDFNQSPAYVQAGQSVEVNFPKPGQYRYRIAGPVPILGALKIDFTAAPAWPDPGQLPYDVSNMDFFDELKPFLARPDQLTKVPVDAVAAGTVDLRAFDSVMVVDGVLPTAPAALAKVGAALDAFAKQGGNVVLTDGGIKALETMGIVPTDAVSAADVYAGHVEFQKEVEGETVVTFDDPLAANVKQPGTAEGPNNRHQVTEPVPIGFAIQDEAGNDANHMPNWGVDPEAFGATGGRVVGSAGGLVTLAELTRGNGRIRILGSLLPRPTEEFDHPFGLADYALTYTGYELTKNLISYINPAGTTGSIPIVKPVEPAKPVAPKPPTKKPLAATGSEAPLAAMLLIIGWCAVVRTRKRLSRTN